MKRKWVVLGCIVLMGMMALAMPVQLPAAEAEEAQGQVNVNTAGLEELQTLPGVGEVIAQRIIEHRETVKPFEQPEDLLAVKGIGQTVLDRLTEKITFEPGKD